MVGKTFVLMSVLSLVLLAGCAGPGNPTEHSTHAPAVLTVKAGEGNYTIVPTLRLRPRYPAAAAVGRMQGCTKVGFRLDRQGRPVLLQIKAGYQTRSHSTYYTRGGPFNRAAVQSIYRWRFRVTDATGHRAYIVGPYVIGQNFIFNIGYKQKSRRSAGWYCDLPQINALIVARAPHTAPRAIQIVDNLGKNINKKIDLARIKVPAKTALPKGWVDVSYCVDKNGNIANSKVKKSSPPGLYDKTALAAIGSRHFSARKENGQAVKTCDIKTHIRVYGASFISQSVAVLNQRPTALRRGNVGLESSDAPTHGKVNLTFCVEADGSVGNMQFEKNSDAVFEKAARHVMHRWQYWPRVIHGKPVRTCDIHQSIAFQNRRTHDSLLWARASSD